MTVVLIGSPLSDRATLSPPGAAALMRAVIFALFLRELKTRLGGRWWGLAWALGEPLIAAGVMLGLYMLVHARAVGGVDPLLSFKEHAPPDALLAVKHHPMDRAYTHYAPVLRRLAREHGLGVRLRYLHDQHLPTLLHHARGVVTINSTVGLQALYHRVPVITLGDSVYQIPGLVYEGGLAQFWQNPGEVDVPLYERFRGHLVASTQLNASFYARRPALGRTPGQAEQQPHPGVGQHRHQHRADLARAMSSNDLREGQAA